MSSTSSTERNPIRMEAVSPIAGTITNLLKTPMSNGFRLVFIEVKVTARNAQATNQSISVRRWLLRQAE